MYCIIKKLWYNLIIQYLKDKGHEIINCDTDSTYRTDYPIYKKGSRLGASGEYDGVILICGTGVGISLDANKVPGIRAVVCSEQYSAKLSRRHNNSNIVAFGAKVIGIAPAEMIVDEFLNAEYADGRHQKNLI